MFATGSFYFYFAIAVVAVGVAAVAVLPLMLLGLLQPPKLKSWSDLDSQPTISFILPILSLSLFLSLARCISLSLFLLASIIF